jgi:8-oxo-dGTP pyrophosphatase MutT (NUDIX family)
MRRRGRDSVTWTLPKGTPDIGETIEETALREVAEETGVEGRSLGKLGDVRYVYSRAGARIFKIVSFYLVRYSRGRLGELSPEQRREVAEARWLPLADAESLLAYRGEREMAGKARARLESDDL